MKWSEEQLAVRREKRSEFLTRLVGEFIKIAFIALFFVLVGAMIWCFVLMGLGITVNYLLPLGISGSLVAIFGAYAAATTGAKASLNKNGLVKNKDGTISKVIEAVATAANNIIGKNSGENVG